MAKKFAPPLVLATWLATSLSLPAQVPAVWQSRGVGGGGALYSPSINPANDSEYYVASDMSELYHTSDFGNSYSIVNFAQVQGGHESAVRFTSNPLIAYTVTYTGGNNAMPAKTADGGATWSVLSGNPLDGDDVYSIWADYNNPNRVIVAGYDVLYFSSNGGTSFSQINVSVNTANGVLIGGAFFDGNNIYLGTNAGLLVSTNGGTSFTNAGTPGIPAGELMLSFTGAKVGNQVRFFCLTAESSYPGIDLGSDYYGNFRGIYSLENGSGNWTARMTGLDVNNDFLLSVAMAQNDLNTVYAVGGNSSGVPVVFKTTNAGGQWTNTFHTASNQNINTGWSGTGGDRSWGYGEVVFGLAVAPGNSARAIFTDYGFVHRTSDGGGTWQQAYVKTTDQHAVNTTAIAGGSYHSIGLEDTTSWQVLWSDAQHLFAGFSDIKGVRSTDGGVTWGLGYTGHNANSMYRLVQHPVSHAIYAATSDIHDMYQSTRLADSPLNNADSNGKVIVSTDQGASWQAIHSFGHPVFWLAIDPTNTNRMYASVVHSTAGGVFVTNNLSSGASSTWTKLPNPPRTEGHPASIVVLNDGKVVCTYSGHRAPNFTASSGVFLYDPGTQAWTDVSASGMLYWTKDVVVDPADATQNTWYVGVFSGWGGAPNGLGGLYRTIDRGAHWTRINALDRVTSITFSPTNPDDAFLTTETDGLWHTTNIHAASPTFTLVANYPFRQPERVFFNPYNSSEVWVTSFGNGLMTGTLGGTAPAITTQPQSRSATTGMAVAFTVVATGTPAPTYQWRKNGINIPGATSATYPIASVTLNDAGSYTVTVTNSAGSVTSSGATLAVLTPRISNDFNGDGKPDLLWQNTVTGQRSIWTMNGTAVLNGLDLGTVPMEWVIAATADFTGDGKTDLLWQNTVTGQRAVWAMDGATVLSGVDLGTVSLDWWIAGVGDFNADGKPDILWTNTVTNERAIWLMNGTTTISGVSLGVVPFEWSIAGAADFNLDGKTDILWSNVLTGERSIWLMNGTSPINGVSLGIFTPRLQISGTGDYNGDGYADILLSDQVSGARSVWLMNGTSIASTVSLGTVGPEWILNRPVPRRVPVDFNADNKSDIVWQNTVTGERSAWLMNGTTALSGISLGTRSTDWEIAATGDFNTDGRADLVWQNNVTGERNIWLMNGGTKLSEVALPTIPVDWKFRATGDFNLDGAVDLVLQNTTTGECVVWFMNGATPTGGISLGVQPLTMQIVGCGDFNADSKADLVWTNTTTGERSIWLMNGATMASSVSLGVVPLQWAIAGTGDFDQDGNADLVWQNTATGERSIWLMNGTSPRSGVSLGTAPTSWSIRN